MIRLREITGQDQLLDTFATKYVAVGGYPLHADFLRRCRVYAFMNRRGAMFGGFLINTSLPFRSLEDMPDEARQQVLSQLDLEQTFEGACMWIARELRGTVAMMRFWTEVLLTLRRFPRRDMLACTVWKALLRTYSAVPLTVLYEGKIHTTKRVLDKYVFVCRGKKGFVSGLALEAMRRLWKLVQVHLVNQVTSLVVKSERQSA